jgi:hypothetical protein
MRSYIETAELFFESIKHKNMPNIGECLDEHVFMTDFNGTWPGKKWVCETIHAFFQNPYEMVIFEYHECENTVFVKYALKYSNATTVNYIDELIFTDESRIYKITKYKR